MAEIPTKECRQGKMKCQKYGTFISTPTFIFIGLLTTFLCRTMDTIKEQKYLKTWSEVRMHLNMIEKVKD